MNFKEHLLGKIAEEACEVGKEALKAQHWGLDSWHPDEPDKTNRDRLVSELNDLLAVVLMLDPSIALEIEPGNAAQAAKVVKVQNYARGFTDQQFFAASPGKARVKAWESYRCAYDSCTFKDFMRLSRVRRCDWPPQPQRFGEKILVGGEEAYWVQTDGHYVWFVRPGQEQILLSHPLDVKELPC